MARKNTLKYQLLTDQSLSGNFISPVTFIRNTDNVSYQINIDTIDSIGSFFVEVSDDYAVNEANSVTNPGQWVRLTLSGDPFVNAADDIIGISLNQLPYDAIRLVYESSTPGTGTCSAIITSKQIGG